MTGTLTKQSGVSGDLIPLAPVDEAMAEEEGEEVEPPKNGKFIFPGPKGDGLDVYDGDWAERELAEGEEPPPEPEDGTELRTYVRHGKGKNTVDGKWTYEGDWVQDKMEGKGAFTYKSGASYDGDWVANKYHGQGTYTWPDGTKYVGTWVDNTMHGQGTYTDKDGREWVGEFYNNDGPGLKLTI